MKLQSAILSFIVLAGCFESERTDSPDGESQSWLEAEEAFQAKYFATPIKVTGRLVQENGEPLLDATVTLGELGTKSFDGGRFQFETVTRRNRTLTLTKRGYYPRLVPLHLLREMAVEEVEVGDVVLEKTAGISRLRFGGDVQLGRRYLDPDEQTPLNQIPAVHPRALISTEDPAPGTERVVEGIRDLMSAADFTSVNLETVVTRTPDDPSLENSFVFFTLPESLSALSGIGIDHVSLANNHIYDYGHGGVVDTIAHLNAAGIPYSGAGMNAREAFQPYRAPVGENNFSFVSMVSIEGVPFRNTTGATEDRSGAADLNNDALIRQTFAQEIADGYLPIGELHTGYEYMETPPEDGYTRERMQLVADSGAALVVSHHPHVAQGFEYWNDVLIAHSLGNLIFDQERLDVVYGAVLTTDFDSAGSLTKSFVTPIYVEGFRPGLISSTRGEWILRRIGYSTRLYNADVHYQQGRGIIVRKGEGWTRTERVVEVEIDPGFPVADLRSVRLPGEALVRVETDKPFRVGRDLMWFGDMEDMDVDDTDEIDRWYYTGDGSFPCFHKPYRGAMALCAVRTSVAFSETVIAFRNRMRVLGDKLNTPNKDLSLIGYVGGENAGPVRVVASYTASFKGGEFGEQTLFSIPASTYAYQPFEAKLDMPADDPNIVPEVGKPFDPKLRTDNPRAVRITIYMGRTEEGEGIVRLDDFAMVSWNDGAVLDGSTGHNPFDFVKLETEQKTTIKVTLASWTPLP